MRVNIITTHTMPIQCAQNQKVDFVPSQLQPDWRECKCVCILTLIHCKQHTRTTRQVVWAGCMYIMSHLLSCSEPSKLRDKHLLGVP